VLGGDLKKAEMLSARLGDMMSYLYMTMAAIRYFELRVDSRLHKQALPYFEYGATWALAQCEKAQADFVANFPNMPTRYLMRLLTNSYSNATKAVSDDQVRKLAEMSLQENEFKAQITHLVKTVPGDGYDINTQAFLAKHKVMPILKKIRQVLRKNPVAPATSFSDTLAALQKRGDLTASDVEAVTDYENKRQVAVRVDEYDFDLNLLTKEQVAAGPESYAPQHKPAA